MPLVLIPTTAFSIMSVIRMIFALALYAIPVREGTFSFTRTILNTPNPNGNITSLNFDNVNETLYATNDTYDQNANFTGREHS
jgi:hypothetical protein